MIILDTNVVSELRKEANNRCEPKVSLWAATIDISNTYLSVITVLEIELGIRQISRRDNEQATKLQTWFDQLMRLYDKRLMPVDKKVAMRAASLHVPDPKPERDAIIAATALAHGFSLATRNTKDFETLNLAIINPWQHSA
ncbi:twitching motility protein PilT [Chromatiales bacterium (ex Bugula neritina AB1)]|nr:twitching motility protein PilT [Chromatiales bacterium (ex Bugula neritina AB1)]